jgi:hypothetical protein
MRDFMLRLFIVLFFTSMGLIFGGVIGLIAAILLKFLRHSSYLNYFPIYAFSIASGLFCLVSAIRDFLFD